MNKTAALLVVMAVLAGCAGAPTRTAKKKDAAKIPARCQEQPQWLTQDDKGEQVAIFICFGERNQLLYVARTLPKPDPALAAAKAEAEALRAQLAEAKAKAAVQPPAPEPAAPAAPEPAPAPLPTVSGTAVEPAK